MQRKKTFIWEQNAKEVCQCIQDSPTLFRIILKTKDEEKLIEKWICHYTKIVKHPTDIIIFDNMSTNKTVLDIYRKYEDRITLIKYSSHFNSIHDHSVFSDLYSALLNSSKFYTLIDTDEFLYFYDGKRAIDGIQITAVLEQSKHVSFFPTFWLKNAYFKETLFSFKACLEYVQYLLVMGKPIICSEKMKSSVIGALAHTLQLPISMYGEAPTCFLLLHLSTLSKEHRIRVNMDKLVQYKAIKHSRDFFTALNVDIESIGSQNARYFIKEIRKLLALPDSPPEHINPDHLELLPDGTLRFYHPEGEKLFNSYANKNTSLFDILKLDRHSFANANTILWELYDKDSYLQKSPPQNKWEFESPI